MSSYESDALSYSWNLGTTKMIYLPQIHKNQYMVIPIHGKVKGKAVPLHTMEAQGGEEV